MSFNADQIYGTIPASLSALANLTWLGVGGNQIDGTLPASLSELRNLGVLEVNSNFLTGSVPAVLFEMPKLAVDNFSRFPQACPPFELRVGYKETADTFGYCSGSAATVHPGMVIGLVISTVLLVVVCAGFCVWCRSRHAPTKEADGRAYQHF
jgi:hypothetical protein